MDNKFFKFAASFVFAFLIFHFNIFAQEEIDLEDDIEFSEGIDVEDTWQILEWQESDPDFVLYYKVIIEQYNKKNGRYDVILERQTESNETQLKIEPRLSPGQYRYKIFTYDLLGLGGVESDYFEFSIYRAYKPRITNISSNVNGSSTIYIDEDNDGIFDVSGRNLFLPDGDYEEKTEYALVSKNGKRIIVPEILSHEKSNRGLKVQIDMDLLDAGTYNLFATDGSGLKNDATLSSTITVKYRKLFDFDISGGYACPIIIYDDTLNKYMGKSVWPLGATLKGEFIFSKHKFGYFGAGLNGHFNYLSGQKDFYKLSGMIFDGYAIGVYQLPLYMKMKNQDVRRHFMTIEVRVGVGLMGLANFVFEFAKGKKSEFLSGSYFGFEVGASVQYFFTGNFFVDVGFDFVNAFTGDIVLGEIIPTVSAGWKF